MHGKSLGAWKPGSQRPDQLKAPSQSPSGWMIFNISQRQTLNLHQTTRISHWQEIILLRPKIILQYKVTAAKLLINEASSSHWFFFSMLH